MKNMKCQMVLEDLIEEIQEDARKAMELAHLANDMVARVARKFRELPAFNRPSLLEAKKTLTLLMSDHWDDAVEMRFTNTLLYHFPGEGSLIRHVIDVAGDASNERSASSNDVFNTYTEEATKAIRLLERLYGRKRVPRRKK